MRKGGSHCPVIWRFAIWYWVLSVTATEPLSSFAAIPSGKQLERKEKCEMKGTRHNGRSGKNGVYNPLHMDTQITGWKRDGIHRFSKEGYGRQRSWVREGTEEGGNEPDKDGFTKLTKAEQLELPFDLPDREKG